jgi:hypothetical protein
MPDTNSLIWISGADLLKRWPFLDAFELAMSIFDKGLRAFDPYTHQFIIPGLHSSRLIKDGIANKNFIEKLRFRESDVLEFESNHFADDKGAAVDSALKDEEDAIKDILKKILDVHDKLLCENCVTKLLAKKALITLKKSGLQNKESQELGRLRREIERWHISIDTAVKSTLHFSKSKTPVKRDELKDFIYRECNNKVTDTAIEKIWKALPERLKKNAGRPKKEKNP